jgi:hypothetical protein
MAACSRGTAGPRALARGRSLASLNREQTALLHFGPSAQATRFPAIPRPFRPGPVNPDQQVAGWRLGRRALGPWPGRNVAAVHRTDARSPPRGPHGDEASWPAMG